MGRPSFPHSCHHITNNGEGRARPAALMPSGLAHPLIAVVSSSVLCSEVHACGNGWGHLFQVQGFSCPLRSRSSSPVAVLSKGQGHLFQSKKKVGLVEHTMVPMVSCATLGCGHHYRLQLQQVQGHRQGPQLFRPRCHNGFGGSTGSIMSLRHQFGFRWSSAELLVVTGAIDITPDH